jgi:hypothetical protein
MGKKTQRNPTGLLDRLLEQGAAWAVTAVLSTGLMVGGGYLLLQFPSEQAAFHSAVVEYKNFATEVELSPFWPNIAEPFKSEWESGLSRDRSTRMGMIATELNRSAHAEEQLEPAFAAETRFWLSTTRGELERAKRRIGAIVLLDEIEKGVQQDMIGEYDARIARLNEMDQMIANWATEQKADRLKRLSTVEKLWAESVGRLDGLTSRILQLDRTIRLTKQRSAQTAAELEAAYRAIQLKLFLAAAGVLVGGGALGFLVFLALDKKFRQ